MENMNNFEISKELDLDQEEQKMLADIKGSKSIFSKELVEYYKDIARKQKKRTKQLSMRLTDEDFLLAKTRGLEEGIPYQVLLASVVHKWLHGKLKDVA